MARILYIGNPKLVAFYQRLPGVQVFIPRSFEDAVNHIRDRKVDTAIVELTSEKLESYGTKVLATCALNSPELLDIIQRHFNERPASDARQKIIEAMELGFG